MPRPARGLLMVFGVVVLGLVAIGATLVGTLVDGHADLSSQCARYADVPQRGGPYVESATVRGHATYFPFGVVCSYDALGAQLVDHQNWLTTGVAVFAGLSALTLLAGTVSNGTRVRGG